MHKVDAAIEAGGRPGPEIIQGMGRLMGEMRRHDVFEDGAGLLRSATRVRLRFSGGERTLEKGPFAGRNELVAAMQLLKVKDMDEAIGWASRYAKAVGDVELEIGPVTEAWDLGVMPRPDNPPLRCLLLEKADAASEAGRAKANAALAELNEEMRRAGVLQMAERVRPSREGMRVKVAGKKPTVIDGPFTESKELIAGFIIMKLPSVAAAHEWCLKFADVIGDVEMDVLPLEDAG